MGEHDEIHGISVSMLNDGHQALVVLLGADGSINRMGIGTVCITEHDLFIGKTDLNVFLGLRNQITSELLSWCGQKRADPHPKGKHCELTVVFGKNHGKSLGMPWRYGSESQGPPPAVSQFVIAAVDATNPWFEQQKRMVRGDDA